MPQRLPSFLPRLLVNPPKQLTARLQNSSNTPTTLNTSEQVSWLLQKPMFIGQATTIINMSRMARHFLRVLPVIRNKKNKIQTAFH
jgi:hypothetical protein